MGALSKMSLKKSFMLIIVISLLLALISSLLFMVICDAVIDICNFTGTIPAADIDTDLLNSAGQGVVIQNENGNLDISTSYYSYHIEPYYTIIYVIKIVVPVIIFIVSLICADIIFFKVKLKKPLDILRRGAEQIQQQNLDFEIDVCSTDELGELCSAFEIMRKALVSNNRALWGKVEERKRLNAAFAHDLRTPLTVLKGQSEMLIKYAPQMSDEKVIYTAEMMGRHITRLENYVNTMNDIQRLEDITIQKQIVATSEIIKQMKLTGASVCKHIEFIFEDKTDNEAVCIDTQVIMQVYENLLSNAVRFTQSKIAVTIALTNDTFVLTVADDGKGFTPKDLSNATKPFYKAGNETDNDHFGMGLNICKIICEKHNGYLELSNDNGAKVIAAFGLQN